MKYSTWRGELEGWWSWLTSIGFIGVFFNQKDKYNSITSTTEWWDSRYINNYSKRKCKGMQTLRRKLHQ